MSFLLKTKTMDIYLKRLTNAYKHVVVGGSVVVDSSFIVALILWEFCSLSFFCYAVLSVVSSFAIVLMGREQIALQ